MKNQKNKGSSRSSIIALEYIRDAWAEALYDGVTPDKLANAALFAALSDLVDTYGEEAVVKMSERLTDRVRNGEFTSNRILQ